MDSTNGVGGQYMYQHFVVDCKKRQTVGNKPNIFATFIIQVRLDVVKSTRGPRWRRQRDIFGRVVQNTTSNNIGHNQSKIDISLLKKMACHLLANRFRMSFINRYKPVSIQTKWGQQTIKLELQMGIEMEMVSVIQHQHFVCAFWLKFDFESSN